MSEALHPLQEKRLAAARAQERGLSQRRVCQLLEIHRSSLRYQGSSKDDSDLVAQIRDIHTTKARYGVRRVTSRLRRRGKVVNHKRVERVMRVHGLQIKRTRKKKTIRTGKSVDRVATRPNEIWCIDFQQDGLISGKKLWILNVLDEFTREWLAVRVETGTSAQIVMGMLLPLFKERGVPAMLRSDNGGEFVAHDLQALLRGMGAEPYFIDPGCPWQNPFIESFHGKVRDELLNREIFASLREARVGLESYRQEYNLDREHSALGYLTPVEFRDAWYRQQAAGPEPDPNPASEPDEVQKPQEGQ